MNFFNRLFKKTLLLASVLFFSTQSYSQNYKLDNDTSFMKIEGTSLLHDWHINVEQQSGNLSLEQVEALMIDKLKLSVKSESLKSGKSRMDKNTYKALNTEDYNTITFEYVKTSNVKKISENIYQVNGLGKLTISGTTREVLMNLRLELKDNMVILTGENDLKMTDFGIDPPKALLGTIKTGDAITISYKSIFKII